MKKIIYVLVFNLITIAAWGQIEKTEENSWQLPADKKVSMNLKFANNIKISTHSSNMVILKTYLQVSNEDLFKVHEMKVSESEMLSINTDYDFGDDRKKYKDQCWNCTDSWNSSCFCLRVRYEVIVPAKANLSLETISGDIQVSGLTGSFSLKTISGNVETQLPEVTGDIFLKSISGDVDIALKSNKSADLRFKSVTGEIYTDFDNITLDKNSTSYSKKLNASLNGGGARVELETVSGDIFFRKGK